jgi:hypothetical protein
MNNFVVFSMRTGIYNNVHYTVQNQKKKECQTVC